MAKKPETAELPRFPVGCIDADALHEACKSGLAPEDALKAALVVDDTAPVAVQAPVEPAVLDTAEEGAE
jgi:hypothetical protein